MFNRNQFLSIGQNWIVYIYHNEAKYVLRFLSQEVIKWFRKNFEESNYKSNFWKCYLFKHGFILEMVKLFAGSQCIYLDI